MGIFDKFKEGFQKSASALSSGIKEIIVTTRYKKSIMDVSLKKSFKVSIIYQMA